MTASNVISMFTRQPVATVTAIPIRERFVILSEDPTDNDCALSSARRRIVGRNCRHILKPARETGMVSEVKRISGMPMALWWSPGCGETTQREWVEARLLVPAIK